MYIIVSILIFIVCILLILFVLVQNSKGGGLAANFSAANQIMGARKSADFLEKATWYLVATLFVLCLLAAMLIPRDEVQTEQSAIEEQVKNINLPATPAQTPPANDQQNNN